jgi:hypothetical protein
MGNGGMNCVETRCISTFLVKMEKHDATGIHTFYVISCTANHQSECTKVLTAFIFHQQHEWAVRTVLIFPQFSNTFKIFAPLNSVD